MAYSGSKRITDTCNIILDKMTDYMDGVCYTGRTIWGK